MKKLILTAAFAFGVLFASAQSFKVMTTIEKDADDSYSMESFTNNIAFGYMCNSKIMAGITMTDAVSNEEIVAEMQLLMRYYHTDELFLSLTTPWSSDVDGVSASDMAQLGIGGSINVWNGLNVDASYSMALKADDNDDRDGSFNLGLSYGF